MTISLGGWLTLIIGAIVLYGGLIICLRIALQKRGHPHSEQEPEKSVPSELLETREKPDEH